MADIRQAALWMMNGYKVKRDIWSLTTRMWLAEDHVTIMVGDYREEAHAYQIPSVDLIALDYLRCEMIAFPKVKDGKHNPSSKVDQ